MSFFNELLDCAWDVTTGGDSTTANYATQENTPTFTSSGQLTIALDVNNGDEICDRVELRGATPQGVAFTDYSNLVDSPQRSGCTLAATRHRPYSPNPAWDVYNSQGHYVGSDPDPLIRDELQRDNANDR